MSTRHLPPFYFRAANAVGPVAALGTEALSQHLDSVVVTLIADDDKSDKDPARDTTIPDRLPTDHIGMAVSLLARLYPRLHLVAADPHPLRALAMAINPSADVSVGLLADPNSWRRPSVAGPATSAAAHDLAAESGTALPARRHVVLVLGPTEVAASAHLDDAEPVHVAAHGWNVAVDGYGLDDDSEPGTSLAWLAAACIGVGEVFRAVFAIPLGANGRSGRQPGGFNLVTGQDRCSGLPSLAPAPFTATLVGAGAIGQAAVMALRAAGAAGKLSVVDPEVLALSNCQRYVLSTVEDVNTTKVTLAARALEGSAVEVLPIPERWGAGDGEPFAVTALMVALDTAADRLGVAAAMPASTHNAWTAPDDLGWSRHEQLGVRPCLACMYYPTRVRPGEHELIGHALGIHPLRALGYLSERLPVGVPLVGVLDIAGLSAPSEAAEWVQRSLMDDLVAAGRVTPEEADLFRDRPLGSMYRDGVCGGGLVNLGPATGDREALVPLAHQSALAGVMLATGMLIAHDAALASHRNAAVESRFDVLRGFPQQLPRPRARTAGCFCDDPDYLAVAASRPSAASS